MELQRTKFTSMYLESHNLPVEQRQGYDETRSFSALMLISIIYIQIHPVTLDDPIEMILFL